MDAINEKLILFVCTANASRSQIAQGWANYLYKQNVIAFSAGIMPAEKLSESAISSMARVGIDISGQYTENVDGFCGLDFDLIVTLSDEAKEYFGNYKGRSTLIHFDVVSPDDIIGNARDMQFYFDNYRDQIRDIVKEVIVFLDSNLE